MQYQRPRSPRDEVDGLLYFPRLCDKVRLQSQQRLHPDYQGNLGGAMDLWTCQFLGVDYQALSEKILSGMTDEEALLWAKGTGIPRTEPETAWWSSFMRNRGYRDDLSERLELRKAESGFSDRHEIATFMDYLEADDLRLEGLGS